ncbi:cytidylate kinase [Vulcanibacillus modesticaldus]|uniref:Cytidylate kinase n=1 Tax=Vulcanibacillus modesticaldus TaxID=337097 RepID=A0A1D2YSK9_9BACI|nr:(d)CMP kinase [Vulcanibacillus modesticaldus]OEF97280.1 cytidylate kinase [Vulcanibacillus modesticaldus]
MKTIKIAIDGPAGAGKSTVAKLVARELGYLYIDTGAMYRALTYMALKEGIDLNDEQELNKYLMNHSIQLINDGVIQKVEIDGEDVTDLIRTPEVNKNVSLVASHPEVRKTMVKIQQDLSKDQSVVMDGRDIGTYVLPNAELKIYLTASINERAKRRYEELIKKGFQANLEEIIEDISLRDKRDKERATAPLKQADDAILIDTSSLSIEEVVEKIMKLVHERTGGET